MAYRELDQHCGTLNYKEYMAQSVCIKTKTSSIYSWARVTTQNPIITI